MAAETVKHIVITGTSRGLGRVLTEALIQAGHVVSGCARSEAAVAQQVQTFGAPHDFAVVDVADEAQVQSWAAHLLAKYGPPDLLINNAALINTPAPLWQVPSEDFSRLIDVNLKGVAYVIRHFVPSMVERRSGIIVNLSSGWGRSTSPEVAPYCASKWAVEGLTQALAQELPVGMAAIPLNPGIIHTDMLDICFGEAATAYAPPSRWVRQAVPFLLQLSAKDNGVPLTVPA